MQTFPKDFDHYVEYTKKRMWKNNFNLILFGRKFLQRGIAKCWNTEIDWIMKNKQTCDHSEFWCQEPISRKVGLLCNGQTKSKTDKNNM